MAVNSLELQLASAVQRFNALRRRASSARDPEAVLTRSLEELSTVLEELRLAQEQIFENNLKIEQLQQQLRRQNERYWQLFDELPQPYLVTGADSVIREVNKAAAELFNISQRFLVGKSLSVFVCEDRAGFLARIAQIAADSAVAELSFNLRPRERAPHNVRARVRGDGDTLRWFLEPAESEFLDGDVARP